jgi:aspartate carbamoyltransferase regulatory subunit
MMECPARNCVGGQIVTRVAQGTSYRVSTLKCAYCGGTGMVSPVMHAAHAKLRKLTDL